MPLHAGVERNGSPSEIATAAPPSSVQTLARETSDAVPSPSDIPEVTEACMTPEQIPLPQTDDEDLQKANVCQDIFLTSQDSGLMDAEGSPLLNISSVSTGSEAHVPPLAEDNLPFVESPLICQEHQAYCLEIPLKAKDIKRWIRDPNPEQLVTLASIGKRAHAEVSLKAFRHRKGPSLKLQSRKRSNVGSLHLRSGVSLEPVSIPSKSLRVGGS